MYIEWEVKEAQNISFNKDGKQAKQCYKLFMGTHIVQV